MKPLSHDEISGLIHFIEGESRFDSPAKDILSGVAPSIIRALEELRAISGRPEYPGEPIVTENLKYDFEQLENVVRKAVEDGLIDFRFVVPQRHTLRDPGAGVIPAVTKNVSEVFVDLINENKRLRLENYTLQDDNEVVKLRREIMRLKRELQRQGARH